MADPGTLSGQLQGKLGLKASKNSIFQNLTSKIGSNSNFATFMKKSQISNCHKNWLVIGMKLTFSGNAYLIDRNKWWKFQRNWRTFIDSLRWPWLEWTIREKQVVCFHYVSIALKLAYSRNKLFKTLPYWSRDILNFDFLDKQLRISSPAHLCKIFQQKCSPCYILLTDHISLPGCLHFLRYWAICVLQLFANPVVMS